MHEAVPSMAGNKFIPGVGGRSGTVHFPFDSFLIGIRFSIFKKFSFFGAAVAERLSSPQIQSQRVNSEIPGSSPGPTC